MDNGLIEQIKHRLPITEVLSTYITLLPSGTQYKARCPFHNEKTASFSVSPERGLYYCFGCGARGDIFTFVEQFEGVDFKGALKILADRAGVVLTRTQTKAEPTDSVYDALETATTLYQELLKQHPEALAYLKNRGVSDETIAHFRLGYAPNEWRMIAGTLDQKSAPFYERAGLIKKTEKPAHSLKAVPGYYDRFRGRIMFPLMDSSGRVVAFSGRMFPDTPEGPKYLNSPETEVFQKSRILFGFDKAKLAIKKHNFAILVEGQMDLVLSHQAGFRNTVATSGTAVSETVIGDTAAQLSVLSRLTPNIFLAFDGDAAGQKALERAALVALSLGMNPKVVALPEGLDPAEFINKTEGPERSEGWKQLLKNAEHFIPYTLHRILSGAPSAHALKTMIRTKLFPFLARVDSAIERQVYLQSIAAECGIGIKEVTDDFIHFTKMLQQEKPQEMTETALVALPVSHLDRFIVINDLYGDEMTHLYHTTLSNYRFNDAAIIFPVLEKEHAERVSALVEKEYGALSEDDREAMVAEFTHNIIAQFLAELRFEYTIKMNEAKQQKNEEEELYYLALLQKLHQHKHENA